MPGSVSMMTGSGMGDAGWGGALTAKRLRGRYLLCNGGVQSGELARSAEAEEALDDAAAAVEEHRVRQAAVAILRPHAAAAHENRERRPKFPHELPHLRLVHVVGDRDDREVLAIELAVQRGHVRELLTAGIAPRGPEVDERDGAGEPRRGDGVAREVEERERRLERLTRAPADAREQRRHRLGAHL